MAKKRNRPTTKNVYFDNAEVLRYYNERADELGFSSSGLIYTVLRLVKEQGTLDTVQFPTTLIVTDELPQAA